MNTRKVSFDKVENYIAEDNFSAKDRLAESTVMPSAGELIEKNLTDKQKCYIMLYYKQGLTMKQIGKLFNINPSTVSRTIQRGRQRVFKGMQRDCFRRLFGSKN